MEDSLVSVRMGGKERRVTSTKMIVSLIHVVMELCAKI